MTSSAIRHVAHFLSGEKTSPSAKPPLFLAFRSSRAFIATAVCTATFTDILLYGIIVPVMPYALSNRVGIPEDSLQTWNAILLACYTIALFVGGPLVGIYADHTLSRRWPLLIGLCALAASTLLLCLGQTIALLVLGRILQGFSAAIVWSVGLALLADTFGDKIGMAMGYSSIAMSFGLLVSPSIGGAVYNNVGYYPVYYVAFGCIVLDVILRLILIEKKVARQWIKDEDESDRRNGTAGSAVRDDSATDVEGTSGTTPNEKRVDEAKDDHGPATAAQPAAAPVNRSGWTAKYPKLRLLKSRRILGANWGIIIQAAVMFSWDTVLPLFVKSTFHWDSTAAGLIFFCLFIPSIVAPVIGWMSDRWGARYPSLAGFVVSIPLLVCLRFVAEDTIGHKVLLGALLSLLGVTLAFANTPLMSEISYAIAAEEEKCPGIFGGKSVYGLGYGLFCTSFALGGSIGALMSGFVMASRGWDTLTWALAVWTAGGAVVVAYAVGDQPAVAGKKSADEGSAAEIRVEDGRDVDTRAGEQEGRRAKPAPAV